jgi:putative FmdB family regulatory protein
MPVYEYRCDNCGALFEEVRHVDARNLVCCPVCGSMPPHVMQWFTTPRNIMPDMPEYYDRGMGTGERGQGVHIRGRSHRREEMRKRGLVEAGDESGVKKAKELLADHAERKRLKSKK